MRISVEPDALRALSRQLEQSGEQIRQMTASLNQAMGSFNGEPFVGESLLNEWQIASRQGEQIFAMLTDMGRRIHSKAEEFQAADQQHNPIIHGEVLSGNPVSMFRAAVISDSGSILPGYTGGDTASISNPMSAIYAVSADSASQQGADMGMEWGHQDQTQAGWTAMGSGALIAGTMAKGLHMKLKNSAAIGGKGARSTLSSAERNPQAWKFVDPKIAVKERLSARGTGNPGQVIEIGVTDYHEYPKGGSSHTAAGSQIHSRPLFGTMTGSAAIGSAIGIVTPVAGAAVGAAISLASGVVSSAVTEIEINGKSLKIFAADGMDAFIDGTSGSMRAAAEGVGHAAKETYHAVTDSVKAVSHGASRIADQVFDKLVSFGMLFA